MTRHSRQRTNRELELTKEQVGLEGPLSNPPIVLWQDRHEHMMTCLGFLAGASLLTSPLGSAFHGAPHYLVPVLGLIGVTFGLKAMFPGALVLDADGLVWRGLFWTIEFRWSDFRRFRGVLPDGENRVEGDMSGALRRRLGWRRYLLGRSGSVNFGDSWELPAARVAEVLREARARWGPTEPDPDTRSLFAED